MKTPAWHKTAYSKVFTKATIGSDRMIELGIQQVEFLISALQLKPKAKILDVPCGVGRHSVEFAKHGYSVTGLDISKNCLSVAKREFSHPNAVYRLCDMNNLKEYREQYEACVNLFTSFGYFDSDVENAAALEQMISTLKPGGKLVINLVDRDWLMTIFNPARWSEQAGVLTVESSVFDKKTNYIETRVVIIDQKKKRPTLLHEHYHRMRIYSKTEILALLKNKGLKNIEVFGDFSGNSFRKGSSTHPIYIAQKG